MTAQLSVSAEMKSALADLLAEIGVDLAITDGPGGTVRVEAAPEGDRRECELAVLYGGGWIACPVARAMASRLGIANRAMGRILDHFRIKVRHCDLGCFT